MLLALEVAPSKKLPVTPFSLYCKNRAHLKLTTARIGNRAHLGAISPLLTASVIVSVLYLGREVLIPFALALLISFVLSPPVIKLEKLFRGRVPAVLAVFVTAFSALGAVSWLGITQLAEITADLPVYQYNINRKIAALKRPGVFQVFQLMEDLKQSVSKLSGNDDGTGKAPSSNKPVPVEIVKGSPPLSESLGPIGASIAHVLTTVAGVLIFTLFMLVQRGELRNRLFRLFGASHLNTLTTALDDAAKRVSKYLISQCIINGSFGLLLGFGLYFIGVPNAPFWGVLGSILRFVPYVGTLIAGLLPLILSLAVFEGWVKPLLTFGLFGTIELTISTAVEPWICGARTGLSSLAILFFASFWTVLWGPIGLVLSIPLTVCLLVIGRYVPQLEFLDIMLGDEPVLPPHALYYQRLLALDEDEARDVAESYLKEKTALELYDSVILPALSLAERDRHQDELDDEREEFIYRITRDLIEDLGERSPETAAASASSDARTLCVGARDEADELGAIIVSQLLKNTGQHASVARLDSIESTLALLAEHKVDVLFVSALPPYGLSQARALCRRARQQQANLKIVVGFWDPSADVSKLSNRLGAGCFNSILTKLSDLNSPTSPLRNDEGADGASNRVTKTLSPATATLGR